MTDDAGADRGAAPHRGFLFSDMRGFTAFAERHGNIAAAEMVGRFLELARNAIARHEGAELKTEGDAIHAVFPSAASAVMCGLEIVDAAAELNEREPDRPLGLGVGVHAGEAVETAEGYIGTAVNLAARLCAAAQPGEILVSSTVKSITQASLPVGFIARGRQRLKGISEPVEIYAVTRDLTAPAARVLPRVGLVVAMSGAAAIVAVALLAFGAVFVPGNLAAPSPQPVVLGPLTIGTYTSAEFEPRITFDIADTGWTASRDLPGLFALVREAQPIGSFFFGRVDAVIANPCVEGGEGSTGPGAADVIAELAALEHIELGNAQPAQVGGFSGEQVDVTIAEGALAACGGLVGADVAVFAMGDEVWRASSGERFRIVTLTVADQPVTIIMSLDWTQSTSVQEMENLFELAGRILDTVEFEGAAPS